MPIFCCLFLVYYLNVLLKKFDFFFLVITLKWCLDHSHFDEKGRKPIIVGKCYIITFTWFNDFVNCKNCKVTNCRWFLPLHILPDLLYQVLAFLHDSQSVFWGILNWIVVNLIVFSTWLDNSVIYVLNDNKLFTEHKKCIPLLIYIIGTLGSGCISKTKLQTLVDSFCQETLKFSLAYCV